ncbi:hypothetical protein MC885_014109 [Smutsia gigantea]|nr:hypothetical protein MC885_014109 [Smutsia gigantea]
MWTRYMIVCHGKGIEVRHVFLPGLYIAIAVVWAIFRNEDSNECVPHASFNAGFWRHYCTRLVMAYYRIFDVQTGSSIYYVSSTIAYAVGIILIFVVLVLMKKGQPALFYLVPCTFITASIVAWRCKEMKKFWKGNSYQMIDHLDYATNEESPVTNSEQIS